MKLKLLLLKIAVMLLRVIYYPIRHMHAGNKVLFISRQSSTPTIDISMLTEYLKCNYPEIEVKVLSKKLPSSMIGIVLYGVNILQQMYHIATSKVVVIDGYCIAVSILNHKENTKIVQMWHALGAIKKFGYQTVGKPGGHSKAIAEVLCMHRNYDYVICPGNLTGIYFMQAFSVAEEKLRYIGLPRIDYIIENDDEIVEEIRNFYKLRDGKKIILYVPTFRKNKNIDLSNLIDNIDFDGNILVVKLHPLDIERVKKDIIYCEISFENVIVDERYSSYQWMNVCDAIITDYSALGIEAALKNKPLYFYIYDYDDYLKDVGLNVDIKKEFEEYAFENAKELCMYIGREYNFDVLNRFRKKYISVSTESCTKQMSEFIIGLIEE